VEKLGSIMVVAERNGGGVALRKAFILARHFQAHIELFLCDAEHAYALRHLYDRRGAEEARDACLVDARRYLEALRGSIVGEDVRIEVDVTCESPAYEGIVRKVMRSCPDLVVKEIGAADGRSTTLGSTDWHLIRTCPAPLMLTHGRSWGPVPRFAAAVDVSQQESPGLARAIAHTAQYLKLGCGATLDLIYSEPAARRSVRSRCAAGPSAARGPGGDASAIHAAAGLRRRVSRRADPPPGFRILRRLADRADPGEPELRLRAGEARLLCHPDPRGPGDHGRAVRALAWRTSYAAALSRPTESRAPAS